MKAQSFGLASALTAALLLPARNPARVEFGMPEQENSSLSPCIALARFGSSSGAQTGAFWLRLVSTGQPAFGMLLRDIFLPNLSCMMLKIAVLSSALTVGICSRLHSTVL